MADTASTDQKGTFKKVTENIPWWPVGFGAIAIVLFSTAFGLMSKFIGNRDDWNIIQPQILNISMLTIFGTIALTVAALVYFVQDPQKAIYFVLVMTCISLGLSFGSIAISVISKISMSS
jgi:hypothetical protein